MAVPCAGAQENARAVSRKKRCTFMIDTEVLDKLQSITARTGLSKSEQIRQGIRWWLESREWPPKSPRVRDRRGAGFLAGAAGSPTRRTAKGGDENAAYVNVVAALLADKNVLC